MDFTGWKWLNESSIINENGEIVIYAPACTDWYNNPIPEDGKVSAPLSDAPVYYTEVEGDFVFSAMVRPNHRSLYDACAIMIIQDEYKWIKAAFEKPYPDSNAVVCVATDRISDDANGSSIEQDHMWIKVCRVGDIFSTHYSLDGENYSLVRLIPLPMEKCVKVGIEAQCPTGDGGMRYFSDLKLELKTVEDLRAGK